jgi:hypothetical protein
MKRKATEEKRVKVNHSQNVAKLNHLAPELLKQVLDFIPFDKLPKFHLPFALTCKDIYSVFLQHPYSAQLQIKNHIASFQINHSMSNATLIEYLEALQQTVKNEMNRANCESCNSWKKQEWTTWRDNIVEPLVHMNLDMRRSIYDRLLSRVTVTSISSNSVSHYDEYCSSIQIVGINGNINLSHYAFDDDCECRFYILVDQQELMGTLYDCECNYQYLKEIRKVTGIPEEEVNNRDLCILIVFTMPYRFGSHKIYIHDPDDFFKDQDKSLSDVMTP